MDSLALERAPKLRSGGVTGSVKPVGGLGLNGKVNACELLVNAVTIKEPKALIGFSQQALQRELGLQVAQPWAVNAGGGKREPNPFGNQGGTG
jgi:hypothetical protein